MNTHRTWSCFLFNVFIPLLILLFCGTEARAGLIFEFDPVFTSEARYDDNIYLTRSKTSDWISTVSPGFISSLSNPRFNAKLEYQTGFVYFLHNPQHDYTRYEVNFTSSVELTPRLTFSLDKTYLRANDPEFEEFADTDYARSVRRNTRSMFNRNTITPRIEYRFGTENAARLYYRNTNFRAGDSEADDYRESFFENEIEYWFNVQNGISVLSHFTKGNFDQDTDLLNSIDVTARYMHRFTPHFQLYGEYGTGVSDFEDTRFYRRLDVRREIQVNSEDVEDYDLRNFNVGCEWELPRNLRIEGSIGYFWRQGVGNRDDQGMSSMFEIEKATRNLTVGLRWVSGYSANFFAVRDAGFSEFWGVTGNLAHTYHENIELRVRGSYGNTEYTYGRGGEGFAIEAREEYRYTADTSLTYHILRNFGLLSDLSLELEYSHVELDSSSDANYYINNQAMALLTATF